MVGGELRSRGWCFGPEAVTNSDFGSSHGEAAGAEPDASPVDRTTVNAGTGDPAFLTGLFSQNDRSG